MVNDKLKEVIGKLKKKEEAPLPSPHAEVEKTEAPIVEPEKEQAPIEAEAKPVELSAEEKTAQIEEHNAKMIVALQNDGVFRLQLLGELSELNKSLRTLNAVIMKASNIESEE